VPRPADDDLPLPEGEPPWTIEDSSGLSAAAFPDVRPPETVAEVRRLVRAMSQASDLDHERHWAALRYLGASVVPYLEEAYGGTPGWRGRVRQVFYAMRHAKTSESAFRLGLAATRDRSTLVRYRACMLLALAGREEAIPALRELIWHRDQHTRDDAAATIAAIERGDPHRFVDRDGTGRVRIVQ